MINRDKPLKKRCLKDLRHAGFNSGLGIRLQGDLRPSRRLAISSMSWCKHPSGWNMKCSEHRWTYEARGTPIDGSLRMTRPFRRTRKRPNSWVKRSVRSHVRRLLTPSGIPRHPPTSEASQGCGRHMKRFSQCRCELNMLPFSNTRWHETDTETRSLAKAPFLSMYLLQDGPLLVINGVITPVHVVITHFVGNFWSELDPRKAELMRGMRWMR